MTTPKELTANKTIAGILWNEWDPIGINDTAPRDEYNSYISGMLQLLKNGASIEDIAQRLYQIETIIIGVSGNRNHCREIATKLKAISI